MLLKFFVWLDNFCYKVITRLAIRENKGFHPKHRILNYHQFFIDRVDLNDTVLDIGCGNGANAYDIAGKAKEVVGIDIIEKNIKQAEEKFKRENLRYLVGDATNYNFCQKFDKIVLSNVLEHIKDRIDFLLKLHKISQTILLRVPMINRDWLTVYKKEKGLEYRLDKTHYIEYTLNDLTEELKQAGWQLENYSVQFGELWGVVEDI